jgi:hypothetical protein
LQHWNDFTGTLFVWNDRPAAAGLPDRDPRFSGQAVGAIAATFLSIAR